MELEKWNIYDWLKKAGMSQYADSFVDNGYDTPDLCAELQDDDLSAIGVNDKRHRTVLFTRARKLMELLKGGEGTDGPIKLQAAPVSPIVVATSPTCPDPSNGQYSEPWQPWSGRGTGGGQKNGVSHAKIMTRSSSGEKPPLPPPNKHKKRHPPPSPLATELPTFKREGGETGLTKLQLQLKIREELRAEGVVLSEPPYVNEEGQLCEGPLSELTERYSSKLKLQPLDIYDALNVIWNSENSFVTPLTPVVQDAPHHHAVTLKGGSSENYDEPFDAADTVLTPDSVKHSPKEGSPRGTKSHTLPVNASSGNYDEPFDSVSKFQNTTSSEDSENPRTEPQAQSKTLPSPKLKVAAEEKEKKKPSAERESSPKHHSGFSKLFRRKDNKRSQSIKEVDSKQREERKNGKKGAKISFPVKSKDNAASAASGKSQKKQNGASPRHSKIMETCSDTEESPQPTKKHTGIKFKKFVTPPTPKADEHMEVFVSSSSSSSASTPEPVRNLRAIRSRGLTGSDLEISFNAVDEDDDGPKKSWMVMSRSFDNLNAVNKETTLEKKKKSVFSKLFKFRTLQTPSRKKTKKEKSKKGSNRSSIADEVKDRESALTNSISMPEIAHVPPSKKKKKRVFVSTSHTPPERFSDDESAKPSLGSSPKHLGVPTSVIPVPSPPHVIPRSRSPDGSDFIGLSPVGGSAPVRSSAFEGGQRSVTPDQAMTPSSAGSKSQSPHSSGSDLAIHDWSGSSSPKSTGSGGGRKPPPPPKPRLLPAKFDDRSLEIQRSSTMPWNKASPRVTGRPRVPLKPTMPGSVPDISNSSGSQGAVAPLQQIGAASGGSNEKNEGKRSPPKPRRNFVTRALSQPNLPDSPLPAASVATPTGSGSGDAIETPPTSDSSTVASGSQPEVPANKTPPTPRQRPPPKPARSIKRKPQRDRVKPEGEDQTPTKVETENGVPSVDKNSLESVPRNLTPPPSNDVAARPPKPFRRLKSPKVIDSSTNQEKENREEPFDGEQTSIDREPTTAVSRTINVSTPSPTSSCPTTIANEGAGSFATEAAAVIHDITTTTTTTTELTKSSVPRSGSAGSSSGGSPKTGKPRLLPKPRALQAAKTSSSTSRTPSKPVPPSKPARVLVGVATPDLS